MTSKTNSILFGTLATLAAVVAIGAYSLGYHQGVQVERRAWEDTRETSLNSVTNKGLITQSTRTAYANPHYSALPFVAGPTGRAAKMLANTPDPRTYRQYDHSSP
ncbi:MAG: hypothetical protein NT167_26850 [Verrucomicrobia bacterium]|nr:hypothetical protein [Verrucomicrobiota bacterium]